MGVPEPRGHFGPSFCRKKQELVEVLRRYVAKGSVAEQGLYVWEQVVIAFSGLLLRTVLLMISELLDCVP